jgi:hypothetical protein
MGNFLQKQGRMLLTNRYYTYFLVVLLALLPFVGWLSLSVIALIVLRKGSHEGFKVMLLGFATALAIKLFYGTVPYEYPTTIATFLLCYLSALALRASMSWTTLLTITLVGSLMLMAFMYTFFPQLILNEFNLVIAILRRAGMDEKLLQLGNLAANPLGQLGLACYLLGVQVLSVVFSSLSSLILARYTQSLLYEPGGLKRELLSIKVMRFTVVILVMVVYAAYQHYPLAIGMLPILLTYFITAGMMAMFTWIKKKDERT